MKGQDDELRHVEGLKNRKMEQQYEMMKGALDKSKNDYDFEKTRADGLENRLKEAELREADLRRKI